MEICGEENFKIWKWERQDSLLIRSMKKKLRIKVRVMPGNKEKLQDTWLRGGLRQCPVATEMERG